MAFYATTSREHILFRAILLCIAFLSGFAMMGYEIFGARILQPWCGSSIHVWGATISVFLGGLSIGCALGGKIADRHAGRGALALLLAAPALLGLLFPFYGRAICGLVFRMNLDAALSSLILASLLFIIPCIFIGSLLPVIAKMLAEHGGSSRIGTAVGNVWAMSNFGCICGTLFSAFFLIGFMGAFSGISLMGAILALCIPVCLCLPNKPNINKT